MSTDSDTLQPAPASEPFFPPRFHILVALLIAATLCWFAANETKALLRQDRQYWPTVEEHVLLPPPSAVRWLSLDYRELSADLMWIWAIQYYTSQHIGITGSSDLRFMGDFIDAIIALDPKFKRVYNWAADAVTFVRGHATQEEFLQSVNYLEQGIKQFPDDYNLHHRAGMRYYLDLYDKDPATRNAWRRRGAELIEAAIRKPGAPPDAATLAASVLSNIGKHERALKVLQQMLLTTDNRAAQNKILTRLKDMTEGTSVVAELEAFTERFNRRWKLSLPFAKSSLYVILGDRPSPGIDFDKLANEHDLFGSQTINDMDESEYE